MGFSHFIYKEVTPNLPSYIAVLIISAILFTIVYKHVMYDIKEIFILWTCYFGEIFSIADVQFMHIKHLISDYYYINFLITTATLYFSIFFFQKMFSIKVIYRRRLLLSSEFNPSEKNIMLIKRYSTVLFVLFLILSVLRVNILGVRSFAKVGGGSGAILRLLWLVAPMLNICSVFLFFSKYRKRAVVFLITTIALSFLAGSKSAVLDLMFLFFAYLFLNPENKEAIYFIKKQGVKLILIGIASGGILYSLLNPGGEPAYVGILHRFVAFGDVYPYAYPYGVIEKVFGKGVSFFQYLTSDLLTTFRIVDRSFSDKTNFAGRLVEYVAGPGINEGPNPRFNALGLGFFGFAGSILFAVLCGAVFALVHRYFVKTVNLSFKRQMIAYVVLNRLINIEQDALLLPQFFTEMILLMPILFLLYLYGDICTLKAFRMNISKGTQMIQMEE